MIRPYLKQAMLLGLFVGFVGLLVPMQTASAATFGPDAADSTGRKCASTFLTFPAWFNGLPREDGKCTVAVPDTSQADDSKAGLQSFIFTIILNVIEIALQLIGYIAVGFIIYGGFKYLTSAGSADRITAGRKVILNAVIGLTLSFFSVAIVNLVSVNITAPDPGACDAAGNARVDADCVGVSQVAANDAIIGILNTAYYAAGIVAVIVIIISAVFYVISQGDPAKIKRAKDGILYAVVGLVVVMLAFIITNYIIGRF